MAVVVFIISTLVFLGSLACLRYGRRQDALLGLLGSTILYTVAFLAGTLSAQRIRDVLFGLSIFFGLGFLTQIAETLWPLRTYTKPKALRLDFIGYGASVLGSLVVARTEGRVISHLPTFPGFLWMPGFARFVGAHLPWPMALVLSIILIDFLAYCGHRLLHTSFLWHTHAAHHSVEHLYWFAGNRASPVHIAIQGAWGGLLVLFLPVNGGFTAGTIQLLLYTCMQHFNHANLNWRLGPLAWLFVSPRYHFVHHGSELRLNNSNFGFLFTVWDRMFGSYQDPNSETNDFPLGLNYEVSTARMFIGLPPERSPAQP